MNHKWLASGPTCFFFKTRIMGRGSVLPTLARAHTTASSAHLLQYAAAVVPCDTTVVVVVVESLFSATSRCCVVDGCRRRDDAEIRNPVSGSCDVKSADVVL